MKFSKKFLEKGKRNETLSLSYKSVEKAQGILTIP